MICFILFYHIAVPKLEKHLQRALIPCRGAESFADFDSLSWLNVLLSWLWPNLNRTARSHGEMPRC